MTNAMPASSAHDVSRAHHLLALMFGHVQTHLIRVAAQLRIADLRRTAHSLSLCWLRRRAPIPRPWPALCGR